MANEYEKFLLSEAESEDLAQRARAFWHLAEYSLNEYELNRALAFNESAQDTYKNAGDSEGVGESRIQHARIMAALGNYDQAIEELDLCSLEQRANSSQSKLALIVEIEASIYDSKDEIDKAVDCYKSSLELYRSEEDADEVIRVSIVLSRLLTHAGREAEALEVLDGSLEVSEDHEDARSIAEFQMARGSILADLGKRQEAFEALEGAAASFKFVDSTARHQVALAKMAKAHNLFGEYQEALALCDGVQSELLRASRVSQSAATLRLRFFYEEAYAHFRLGNLDEAKRIATENVKVARSLSRHGMLFRLLRLLGSIAESESKDEAAERYYRDALEANQKRDYPSQARFIKLNLARILVDKGADQEVIDLLESFDIYSWSKGNFESRQLYFCCLMLAYLQLGNLDQGRTLAYLVLDNAIVSGAVSPAAMLAHDTLSAVEEKEGNLEYARLHGVKALSMAIELEHQPVAQRLSKRWLG